MEINAKHRQKNRNIKASLDKNTCNAANNAGYR